MFEKSPIPSLRIRLLAMMMGCALTLAGCIVAPAPPPVVAAGPAMVGTDPNGNVYTYAAPCCYAYEDYPPNAAYYYYPAPLLGYGFYDGRYGYYGSAYHGGVGFRAGAGFHGGFGRRF